MRVFVCTKNYSLYVMNGCLDQGTSSLGTGAAANWIFKSLPLSVSDFTQSVYGSILALKDIDEWVWPPSQMLQAYAWWCETYGPQPNVVRSEVLQVNNRRLIITLSLL